MLKKILFQLILLSSSLLLKAQLRKVETFYDKEKKNPKEIYFLKNEKPDGLYESFYYNNKLKSKGIFDNGIQIGNWFYYYTNGHLKMNGSYITGKRSGEWTYYFENGKKQMTGNLKNGTRDGLWKFYYENEELKSVGSFLLGKKENEWKYYYEDGVLKATSAFKSDKGFYTEYDHNGKKNAEGWIVNGQSDSTWKYFYNNGKLKAEGIEKNGLKNGVWKIYHNDETLAATGNYNDGLTNGKWIYFHKNGKVSSEGVEKSGQKDGKWNLYYPTGSFKGSGEFIEGSGIYKEYYESGKIKTQGLLVKGIYEGLWRDYYEDGNLEGEINYKNGEGIYNGFYPNKSLKMKGEMKNGKRIKTWELFKADGTTAGFYKNYHDEKNDNDVENEFDTILETSEAPKDSIKMDSVRKKLIIYDIDSKPHKNKKSSFKFYKNQSRYFKPRLNEYRAFILSANPIATIFNQLPFSIEYYMRERLGYEFTFSLLRYPFFKMDKSINNDKLYLRGQSFAFKQKFYNVDTESGMFYFAHEIKYTSIIHSAKDYDSTLNLNRLLTSNEKKIEYSILLGDRWMQRAGARGFTFDIYVGIGVGYRNYKTNFEDNKKFTAIFENLKTSPLVIPLRVGFSLGYSF